MCAYGIELASATRFVTSTANDPNSIGTLPYWLLNSNDGDVIDCNSIEGQSITLTSSLPAITKNYTINGAGITINGDNQYQAFQVASGTVAINNVTVEDALSKGGDGGSGYSGGGGAVGGGGALYVHKGSSVTITASSLLNNSAQGGNGGFADIDGNTGAGGGGGFGGGNGGDCLTIVSTGGGGGGHSNGGDGGSNSSVNGSNGVYFGGGGGGAGINSVVPGGSGGNASPTGAFVGGAESAGNGGGGAGDSQNGVSATGTGSAGLPGNGGNGIGADSLFGGGGGGGCSSETGFPGGSGVGAAGGGGGSNYGGGTGGILGGGGGGGIGAPGGDGGFGAGGGGAVTGGMGGGGFNAGGGNGGSDPSGNSGGGGGSGLGGAIFIQSGGSLTLVDAGHIVANSARAGVGGGSSSASDPGYMPAGDGIALGHDIFVREEGSITFNLSTMLALANPIEGDQTSGPNTLGGLQKIGTGTLKLNGANTYSGMTTVNEGTLNLNGSVIGSVAVGTGGTLSGNATVAGDLANAGILAPGNSIGTINTTNLVLTPSSVLDIEVASNGISDLIHATGTATLNGSVQVSAVDGIFTFRSPYTIVTADGSLTGTFVDAISAAFITPTLTYDANSAYLTITSALRTAAQRCNQIGVATLLDSIITINDAQALLISKIATLPLADAQKALESVSGFQYTNEVWTTEIANSRFLRRLYDPLRYQVTACAAVPCFEWTPWLETGPDFAKVHGNNAHTTKMFSYQVTGGIQKQMTADFCFGVGASYEYDHETFTNAHANRNAGYIGIYGLYRPTWCYALFDIAYGHTGGDVTRTIQAGDLCYTVSGNPKVDTFTVYGEYGIDMNMKWFLLQPFMGLQVEKNWRAKVIEQTRSGWGLIVGEQQWAPVNARLGIHLSSCNVCQDINVSIDLAWDQRLTSTKNTTQAFFKEFGDCYCICGNQLDKTSVDYALTFTKTWGDALQWYVEFEGQWWNHANTNGVLTGIKYSW